MSQRTRRALVAVVATVALLGGAAGTAAASTAIGTSVSSTTATGGLTFRGGGVAVTCSMTATVSFPSSSIVKTATALVAQIGAGAASVSCNFPGVTMAWTATPWARYVSFSGTLPNITGIDSSTGAAPMTFGIAGGPFPVGGCQFSGPLSISFSGDPGTARTMSLSAPRLAWVRGPGCPLAGILDATASTLTPTVTLTLI